MSRPSVHPIEPPPQANNIGVGPPPYRTKDFQGMPGTAGGLVLRLIQFAFATISVCVMTTTGDFAEATAFRCLVGAAALQSLWSLSMALLDLYAVLVMRSLQNKRLLGVFVIGDLITSMLTFASASASAGITVHISDDLEKCNVNPCARFISAVVMAYISWFATYPSFFLNFITLALLC